MSLMENVGKKRFYFALDDDTFPHRLLIQTRITPSNSVPETLSLLMILVVAHQSESARYGLTFPNDFLHVDAEYFRWLQMSFQPVFPVRCQWTRDVFFSASRIVTSISAGSCAPMLCGQWHHHVPIPMNLVRIKKPTASAPPLVEQPP